MPKGIEWDELKVSKVLQEYRNDHGSKGASFETIGKPIVYFFKRKKNACIYVVGGFGPNGAIIHYSPAVETNAKIDTSSLFLLDSGGQYYGIATKCKKKINMLYRYDF